MDGEPPVEEDFSQIPLVERSQHKNWKARVSAYTDVISKSAKTASDTDPFFKPYITDGALLKKWCTDANAVAQEKGIEAVLAIAQYSGESSARIRSDVVPSLVEKSLGAARAGTKKRGTELALMFVEVENTGEGVMTDIIPGLDAKQPKVVAGCIGCLKEIIESFGVAAIGNIKPLIKTLPKIFGHSDKTVRAEGTALVLALYAYLGPAVQASLGDLKPVQLAELQKSFDSLDADGKGAGTGKPSRFTRKAQREQEASGGADTPDEVEAPAPMDPKDLLEAVDVSKLFPADLDERLSSSKWKDRLEALEEVNKVLSAPANVKIAESNMDAYGSLAQTLGAKCKSDANVNVVIEAAKVVEGLAMGLGKPFGRYRNAVMPGMLERLKERKATVVEALGKALDAVFTTVPLSDIIDDVLASAKSKNPQVKEGTLRFLYRSLCTTTDAPNKDQIKPMAEALVALLGDSTEPVRSGAADCLGTMMKILGERTFNPFIENVGELQMAKVKDAFAKAEIRYKGGAKPSQPGAGVKKPPVKTAPRPGSPPIKSTKSAQPDEYPSEDAPKKAPPARLVAKMAPKAAPPAAPAARNPAPAPAAAKPAGGAKTLAASPSEPVKYRYSPEDAASRAEDMVPAEYHIKLADGAWKIRLEAAEEMTKWATENASTLDSEVVFRFLCKTPGWGEKNFQVSAKLYEAMRILAEQCPTFGRPSAALLIGPLAEKLGDMKLKKPAGDALTAFAEKTSFAFVLAQAYEPLSKVKAPKAQADAMVWIKQAMTEFGIAGIPLRDLIGFVKTALGNANAMVRSSATQLLVTIRIFVGADISGFLEDVNPQLLSTINSEFEKAASQTAPEVTRTQADLQEAVAPTGKAAIGGADPLDDLIPRVDLDKLVNQTSVLADSKSDAWKTRKEAFEALNTLLEVKSNSRLKSNMGEIGSVLKKAMADTNLAVKMLALGIITKISIGMGTAIDKHTRLLTTPVASVCADQKVTTRSAALATLGAMADAAGSMDSLYPGLGTALESANPALRGSVLGWLAERLKQDTPGSGADMTTLAAPVLSCLEDRNGDVRKGAMGVLPFVVSSAGYDYVMGQTSRLKPASKATIVPLIQNARDAAAPAPAAAPAKAAKPTTKPAAVERPAPPSPAPVKSSIARPPPRSGIPAPGRSMAMKALANAPARPPSAMSDERPTGLPKPKVIGRAPAAPAPAPTPTSSRIIPFTTSDSAPRAARLKRDAARWILEPSPKSDLLDYLHGQMEAHTSSEMYALLFSKDHRAEEDYMAALSTMAEFYDEMAAETFDVEIVPIQAANVDLAVKYAALKLLSNNTQLANRCLEVIGNVIGAMRRADERFSDAEAKLFVPALVFKLGDAKFVPKLAPIFDNLDKIIAGSQVVQLLVQYGLEDKSAGKTCKNESLALIEKAYRKRGSVLRVGNDRAFYEVLAKCVGDSGTRNAALSVMALLQLQGANRNLEAVIESMPNASKDMLANRRTTMAAAKAPAPLTAKVNQDNAIPSPRARKAPPKLDDADIKEAPPSPVPRAAARVPESPSRVRNGGSPAPLRSGIPTGIPVSRIPAQRDVFGAGRTAMQPLARPASAPRHSNLNQMINNIRQDDLDRAVDALKALQEVLANEPETAYDVIRTLVDALTDEMQRAYTPTDNLRDPAYFRLVKHLIQTISSISSNETLLRRLEYDDVYAFLDCLTLHLVQSDLMGGNFRELSKFINLILIQVLSQVDRLMIFKAMFKLLYSLSANFARDGVKDGDEPAVHADLVIKCLWKRCKVLDEEFRSGRLPVGATLVIVEEFLSGVGPAEWRRRAQAGVALGDMPLRTIKTIIQRAVAFCRATGVEIYEILVSEFGDDAANTIVYSYVFRLAGQQVEKPVNGAPEEEPGPLRPASLAPRPRSVASQGTESAATSAIPLPALAGASNGTASNESSPAAKGETEALKMVRGVIRGGRQAEHLDALHVYMTSDPLKRIEVEEAISGLSSAPVQTYLRRALEQRDTSGAISPTRPEGPSSAVGSPTRSPSRRVSDQERRAARRSLAPRPASMAMDKSAPPETQLASLKNLFFSGAGQAQGMKSSQSADMSRDASGSGDGNGVGNGIQDRPKGLGVSGFGFGMGLGRPGSGQGYGNGHGNAEVGLGEAARQTSLSKDVD